MNGGLDYAAYEARQHSKLGNQSSFGAAFKYVQRFDNRGAEDLRRWLSDKRSFVGSPVLCVGARLGGEVRAFQALEEVELAVGIDFNPGDKNRHVMYGDAHHLIQFKNRTFGTVFSNVLDHILYIDRFAAEAHRVLKPRGTLLVHMMHQTFADDHWAVHDMVAEHMAISRQIEAAGFEPLTSATEKNWAKMKIHKHVYRALALSVPRSERRLREDAREEASALVLALPQHINEPSQNSLHLQQQPIQRHQRQPSPSSNASVLPSFIEHGLLTQLWHRLGCHPFGGFDPFDVLADASYLRSRGGGAAVAHIAYKRRLASVERALPNESALENALALDADVLELLRLLLLEPMRAGHVDSNKLALRLFDIDQPARVAPPLLAPHLAPHLAPADGMARGPSTLGSRLALASLRSDGFLKVRSWAEFGLDTAALARAATAELEAMHAHYRRQGEHNASVLRSAAPNISAALAPLLHSRGLAALVRGHLGGTSRFEGHSLLEVRGHATASSYRSALWHHDRCGRRLKLFIYLDDVTTQGGRPTVVARDTHNTLHFSYGWHYALSRFSDDFVRSHYDVEALEAPAGGGFLLDTNALHRAALERGRAVRRAVVLEFHQHGKVQRLGKVDNPCPSGRPFKRSGRPLSPNWWQGEPGWPLYPVEPANGRQQTIDQYYR